MSGNRRLGQEDLSDDQRAEQERGRLLQRAESARREAEASARRFQLLAEASAALAASDDLPAALTRIADLAVPHVADYCFFDVEQPDGELRRLAWKHADPARRAEFEAIATFTPRRADGFHPVVRALDSCEPIFVPSIDDAWMRATAVNDEHLAWLRRMGVHSALVVPLTARGRRIGSFSFALTDGRRQFGEAEISTARALGERAAIAIDNIHLLEAAQAARAQAEAATRAKDEFLAMLGHELRNPLAPIVTALQLMKLRGDVRSTREQQVIERQVDHLVRLVDDLLDVARITRGKVELKREAIDLSAAVAKAVEIASPLLEQRRHHFTVEVPRQGMRLDADPVRLAQVIANLLTNAARYTEPGGEIALEAWRDGPQLVLRVRDNGIGMTPDMAGRVFDLFVQGPRSMDRAEGGLGIGLTLVRNLVQMHGGSVAALSDGPGRGSAFVVRLPALPDLAEPAPAAPSPVMLLPARTPRRLLVVDDNIDAAELLAEVLRSAGHEVEVAHDGAQALAVIARFRPDVAVLDIGLPVMDGYELALRLREALGGERLHLLAVTGYGQDHDRARARSAGFSHHLVKPIDIEQLLTRIDGV